MASLPKHGHGPPIPGALPRLCPSAATKNGYLGIESKNAPEIQGPIKMKKLKQTEIFGYALGDLGINFNFQAIGFLLSFYYTDIFGISPAHVAGLLLVARIWDAINDPLMGFMADRTKTRLGQFRPYLLIGALPLNLVLLACFYTPDMSETGRVIYAYVTYISHGMILTLVGLPYSSLSAVMTQNQQERAVIGAYRMFFACVVAQGIVTLGIPAMVRSFEASHGMTKQMAYFSAACILAAGSVLLLWTSFFASKERVSVPRERYRPKDILKIIRKNDALLALSMAMLLNTGVWVTGNAVAFYYFKYILGKEEFGNQYFAMAMTCNLIGAITAPMLTRRFGKRTLFMGGSLVVVVTGVTRYFVPTTELGLILAVSAVFTVGQMYCSVTQWGMLPDTVEYGHWKTGQRSEGMPFAVFSFMQKAGMALAGSMATAIMAVTGYVANTDLSPTASEGILWLFNIVPAAYSGLCLIALTFYKITGPLYDKVISDLEQGMTKDSGLPKEA
jgi:sugar (glycoside-pentoside-hexuronide) transporter